MKQRIAGTRLTLEPLRAYGPDALDTHDTPGLLKATLTGLEIHWHNRARGITIRKAEDLFAGGNPARDEIPETATLAKATFEIVLAEDQRPHKIAISPPDDLDLETPAHAPLILTWLDKRHFWQALVTLLIIATALAPAFDDNDGDDDDLDADRTHFAA